jgi:YVTN family beta-propeller protein
VAITPDGASLYVTDELSGVTVADAARGVVRARLAAASPFGVALSPDGTRAYVAGLGRGRVTAIDTGTRRVASAVAVGGYGADPFTVRAAGDAVYVADQGAGTLSVLDRRTLRIRATIPTGEGPYGIAVVPAPAGGR